MNMIDTMTRLNSYHLSTLKSNNVPVIGRYIGYKTHGWSKALTVDEAKLIASMGLHIVSIWEGNPTHVAYFTYAQGLSDAKQAVTDAQYLGQPLGTAIYFTVDYDAQPSDFVAIANYFRGVRAGIGGYKVGGYGSHATVEYLATHALCDYYMQTCAWSYGKVSAHADIHQRQCDTTAYGLSVDIDDIVDDCGMWPVVEVTKPVNYPTYDVVVVAHPYKAIVVKGDTYVLWTALNEFGTRTIVNKGNGVLNVDGKDIQGVVYNGDTYVMWRDLVSGIHAHKVEWLFNK